MGTWVHFLLYSLLAPSPEAREPWGFIFARGGKLITSCSTVAGSKEKAE